VGGLVGWQIFEGGDIERIGYIFDRDGSGPGVSSGTRNYSCGVNFFFRES
jgi:hypothetical protein